jgi:integrase
MRVFSVEEAKTSLKAAPSTMNGTLFAVAVTTGMGPSEYIGLKWQDVDWERRTVSVKRTLRKGPTGQWEYGRRSAQEVGELSGCRIGSLSG